jgi:SPP1 gp7 family putative phage head morphogenesis protein
MPKPRKREPKNRFIRRCIPMVVREGRARKQAIAICYSLWAEHGVTVNARRNSRNPIRMDPTRTTMIRKRAIAQVNKRFRKLKGAIRRLVAKEDAFGLKQRNATFNQIANTRWQPLSDSDKINEFRDWVREQIDRNILTSTDASSNNWLQQYIEESYDKGRSRSYDDYRKGYAQDASTADVYQGSKEEFLQSAFDRPVMEERVRILAERAYTDLKNVTEQMATQMNRVVTDGIIRGESPYEVARKLNEAVDKIGIVRARTIARTETIRAHAEGQLDTLEALGVEDLGVMVEWSTAGDDRVCPLCLPLDGIVIKMKEARGMLPRHPNCRCAWIPANLGETRAQKRSKAEIDDAMEESLKRETAKKDRSGNVRSEKERLKQSEEKSKWQGADVVSGKGPQIAKDRPKSILDPDWRG